VILSERAARALWPGEDPIGRRVVPGSNLALAEVVGVVGDVRSSSLEREGVLVAYVPLEGSAPRDVALLVRTSGRPKDLVAEVARAVREVGPTVAVAGNRTLDEVVAAALARRRFQTLVLAIFAGSALATASVGIAGIISHALTERSGEIAVRMALGARPADVTRLVWREEMRPVGTGLGLGVAASLALVAALACWIPTRKATSAGPTSALRLG
jgi:hypothetical protein